LEAIVNRKDSRISPYVDGEPKYTKDRSEVESVTNKHVFILDNYRVIDNRLYDSTNNLRSLLTRRDKLDDSEFVTLLQEFEFCALPDFENKYAPRFMSSRFNPNTKKNQMLGQIDEAKYMGHARHVSVVIPKTIMELPHSFEKKWNIDARYDNISSACSD